MLSTHWQCRVVCPYRITLDTAGKIIYSSDSSTSDESLHLLSPWFPKTDNNGLLIAASCDETCFQKKGKCDNHDWVRVSQEKVKCDNHDWAEFILNLIGDYLVFPSMCYHCGFFSVKQRKTLVQVQLFAMHSSNPDQD